MQSRRWTKFAMVAILGLWSSSQVGCARHCVGGGFIDSVTGAPQKATFGFNIKDIDQNGEGFPDVVRGEFQYHDYAAGVSFHVDQFDWTGGWLGFGNPTIEGILYQGTYISNDGEGEGEVWLAVGTRKTKGDGTDILDIPEDMLYVEGLSGPYANYVNFGVVQGANFQFYPPNTARVP